MTEAQMGETHWLSSVNSEGSDRTGTIPHPVEWVPLMSATEDTSRVTCQACLDAMP